MGRLDHAMIYVLIAGTYTPFSVLLLPHTTAIVILSIVWGGADVYDIRSSSAGTALDGTSYKGW